MDAEATELLEQIHAEMRAAGEQVQDPADPADLDGLHAFAERELRTPLPQAYLDFLRRADGLDFNGTVVYASRQRALPEGGTLLGFAESNRAFASGPGHHHVLFAETGDDLFALDREDGTWLMLDRSSLSKQDEFPDCGAMLQAALRRAYEG
jgi:hypothetical protein